MGFLDNLLGRSKPVRPDLDQLFGLPSAAVTLESALGMAPTGTGSVAFRAPEGKAFADVQSEIQALLDTGSGPRVQAVLDTYGYTWLVCRTEPADISALVTDLHSRGLEQDVSVVAWGEFGRTPKISYAASTGEGNASAPAGTMQPGRDHWPRAFSNIWAGGGIETGRFIGATDKRGEDSTERICNAGDFLATIYHHLGIDAARTLIKDFNGRPTPVVDHGKPIPELMG